MIKILKSNESQAATWLFTVFQQLDTISLDIHIKLQEISIKTAEVIRKQNLR